MADSRGPGLVAAEGRLAGHGGIAHRGWFDVETVLVEGRVGGLGGRYFGNRCIVTGDEGGEKSGVGLLQLADGYSCLKHRGMLCSEVYSYEELSAVAPIGAWLQPSSELECL